MSRHVPVTGAAIRVGGYALPQLRDALQQAMRLGAPYPPLRALHDTLDWLAETAAGAEAERGKVAGLTEALNGLTGENDQLWRRLAVVEREAREARDRLRMARHLAEAAALHEEQAGFPDHAEALFAFTMLISGDAGLDAALAVADAPAVGAMRSTPSPEAAPETAAAVEAPHAV